MALRDVSTTVTPRLRLTGVAVVVWLIWAGTPAAERMGYPPEEFAARRQRLAQQRVRLRIRQRDVQTRIDSNHTARNVPQNCRRSTLRLLERSSTRRKIRGHSTKRREHRAELDERLLGEIGFAFPSSDRKGRALQRANGARERARGVPTEPKRSQRSGCGREQHEDAEVSPLTIERQLLTSSRRGRHDPR